MRDGGLRRYRYRGLRVIHDPVDGPLTAIALSVRAGARFDGRHPGIAHVTEHMLFQGTATLDQLALNRRAAELGGEHNADTGHEDIAITFEVFNEDFDDAIALLAEQYYHTRIDPARFFKERRVILDEIRGRAGDSIEYVHTRLWSRFFAGALSHPVWGSIGSVLAMKPAHVARFLRRHFVHERTVLAVAGGVSAGAVARSIRRHFCRGGSGPPPPVPPVELGRTGVLRIRRRNGNQSYAALILAVPRGVRQLIAIGIALDLVGSDPDSRLFQAVRETYGLGYDVSASLDWGPDWSVAVLAASGAPGSGQRLLRIIQDTCRRAAEEGFGSDELARARKKLRYRYASLARSPLDRALALASGTLCRFPPPADAERLVQAMSAREVEDAWRRAVGARWLAAVMD